VRLQRSFVPYEPRKRLYAINVGTPAGIHYAYDFKSGAVLRVWRGSFLNTIEMWDNRGEAQLGRPAGPALTLNANPTFAILDQTKSDWLSTPEESWSSQGYRLEADGQPVFLNQLGALRVSDRIAPSTDGRGLTRTINLTGANTGWETWVLLAESDQITPQADGRGYIVGDHAYYLDLPADSTVQPVIRKRNGRQQLAVYISDYAIEKPIVYTLVW
jgi:hypothetical protein